MKKFKTKSESGWKTFSELSDKDCRDICIAACLPIIFVLGFCGIGLIVKVFSFIFSVLF